VSRYAAPDALMAVFGLARMTIADMLAERAKLLAQVARLDEALASQGATVVLRFTIPGAPVPKGRPRVVRSGGGKTRGVTPPRTRVYEATVGVYALQARQLHPGPWPLDVHYSVTAEIAGGRGDLDNVAKSLLDGCNGVLWSDDARVRRLLVERVAGPPGARVRVEVLP